MSNESMDAGIVSFDFQHTFPHIFWVSNWSVDGTYPTGICYKILSVRDENTNKSELVLIRNFRDGTKEVLHRAYVPLIELKDAAGIFVDGLSKKLNLDFEEQDYRTAKTLDEFHRLTTNYGWSMKELNSTGQP